MDNTTIDTKTCQHCQSSFDITQSDLEFYDKISPSFAGHKFQIPTPTLCPDCRQRRRLSFRNERKLYRRQCDASQKSIISIYSPDKPYTVYDQSIWWSDSRDPMDYGCEFDFTRTFGENFRELMKKVPLPHIANLGSENCDFAQLIYSKSCYMSFVGGYSSDILYSNWIIRSEDCVDCYKITNASQLYQCVSCSDINYSYHCYNCYSGSYLQFCCNVEGSHHCFLSSNIQNSSYFFLNKKLSKDEYELEVGKFLKQHSLSEIINIYQEICFTEKQKIDFTTNRNCENVDGEYLINCNNCIHSNDLSHSDNCKYVQSNGGYFSNVVDVSYGINTERSYDSLLTEGSNLLYTNYCLEKSTNLLYSLYCNGSSNLFGCIGLRNQQYCIFNRQYENKEQYEEQVSKIIQHMMTTGEWGEFFHPSLSPFGYNETVAQEYYPVTLTDDGQMIDQRIDSEDVKSSDRSSEISSANLQIQGYKRSSYEAPTPQVDKVIKGQDLPDTITDVTDDILKVAIQCEVSNKLFRIIPQELIFYRKHNISLPRKHPDVRHLERMALRR